MTRLEIASSLIVGLLCACGSPAPPSAPPAEPAPSPEAPAARAEAAPARIRIAVTLDDLPFVAGLAPGDTRGEAIARMLDAARAAEAPLAGFVTCGNARPGEADLRRWIAGGVAIGNHTRSHRSIDDLGLDGFRADLERCQTQLQAVTGAPVSLFRYPFLRTGADPALRDAGFAALTELGLRRAMVSVDTSEWALVAPYVEARRRGAVEVERAIADAYVEHVRRATQRYAALAAQAGHADAPQILLLHANALAADHLGEVLAMLREEGFDFVPLEEALRDPLYAREDRYAGEVGLSWLYRISGDATAAWAWDAAQLHALRVRFGGRNERARFDLDRELSVRRVAERTFVITHDTPWAANSLLAEMPDGTLLLVDTPYTAEATRSVLDWAAARFGPRRLVAINTHHHVDAVGGNAAILAAGGTVHGSRETARLVSETAESMRESLARWLEDRPDVAARFSDYAPVPPNRTFDAAHGLHLVLGGEPVDVIFPGPAHSSDNLVVHFPARRLLFGGCAVLAGERLGNMEDADRARWPAALEAMRALDASIVIPGHGDRIDPGLLDHSATLLQ